MRYIMCYGDSNTHGFHPKTGFRYPEDVRWTGRLAKMMGEDYKIIEEGLNGRTTTLEPRGETFKSGSHCMEAAVRTHMPLDLVILMLGSNDMKRVFHQTAKAIGSHVQELIHVIKRASVQKSPTGKPCRILLVAPPLIRENVLHSAFGIDFDQNAMELSRQLAPVYEAVAKEEKVFFLDAAKYAQAGETDGLHLEEEGHKHLAEAIAVKVWEIFALG